MALLDRADSAFEDALAAIGDADLLPLRRSLVAARAALGAPMRVAVIGRIKAGKSTLMNALLAASVAPTGAEELTYNVTSFVHADRPELIVHFKDGRAPESYPIDALARFVDRKLGEPEVLRAIRRVEVRLSNAILERLELIDTPGFGSFFEADSRNTLEFLGLTADDVDQATREQAIGADAVAYLFTRGLAATDRTLVTDFEGAGIGDFTPMNAIAVLTHADAYWSAVSPDDDPLAVGQRITNRIKDDPGVERIFFDVVPVCGLLASGAAMLESCDIDAMRELASLPAETLIRRLANAPRFASAVYEDSALEPQRRRALVERLGQYGIWTGCALIRDGITDRPSLQRQLLARSGIETVRELLLSHYANRATLIKASAAANRSRAACSRAAEESDGATARAAASAAGRLEAFELEEHAITELALLRQFYRDQSDLGLTQPEADELLAVCGERGGSCFDRLGVDRHASIEEMLVVVADRLTYWRRRADQFGVSSKTIHAVRQLQRSYERIAYHLEAADEHLEMTI